jgi:hypothetical protein
MMNSASPLLRRLWIAVILPLSCFGQGQLTCERVEQTTSVRAEGTAELVGDIVLKCTGGTPTARGSAVPTYQVMVASSVPLSSRILVPGVANTGLSEALLIIDDPGFHSQIGCATTAGGDACPAIAGSANANVFQGRQVQANTMTFRGVPVDAPGPSGTRILRISNLRVDATALAKQSPKGEAIQLSVQMMDSRGTPIAVRNFDKTAIQTIHGAQVAVRTLADTPPALNGSPVITIPPASLPVGAPQILTGFNLKYTRAS